MHRVVAARGSLWINKQLSEPAVASQPGPWRLAVPFEDPAGVLERVLKWLYTGQIEIADNATAINTLARSMDIPLLTKQVAQYLASTVQRHNCVSMLRQAIALKAVDVERACLEVVARNFSFLEEKDWTWLSYDAFLALLRAEYFQARSEMHVFELIRTYCASHPELSNAQRRVLQEETRFRFFTVRALRYVFVVAHLFFSARKWSKSCKTRRLTRRI